MRVHWQDRRLDWNVAMFCEGNVGKNYRISMTHACHKVISHVDSAIGCKVIN